MKKIVIFNVGGALSSYAEFDDKIPKFDPTTISDQVPLQVNPNFTEYDTDITFSSMITDSQTSTSIFVAHYSLSNLTDLGALPEDVLHVNDDVLVVDVKTAIIALDVDICLPAPSIPGFTITAIMFLNTSSQVWQTEDVTLVGNKICALDVNHTSSWAVGGVKALALGSLAGGGGGGAPTITLIDLIAAKVIDVPDHIKEIIGLHNPLKPIRAIDDDGSFDFPLSIDGKGYALGTFSNTLETHILQASEPAKLKIISYDRTDIEHVSFYLNLHDAKDSIHHSDTQILWNAGEPLKIIDPHGFFESVSVIVIEEEGGLKKEAILEITFAKEMDTTDLIIRQWNENLQSSDTIIRDALMILPPPLEEGDEAAEGSEEIPEPGESETEVSELKMEEISVTIPDWIKTSAKWWNEGHVTDAEFANAIEVLIEKKIVKVPRGLTIYQDVTVKNIPDWLKSSAGWWGDGLVQDKDFVNGIKWLVEKGIIRID